MCSQTLSSVEWLFKIRGVQMHFSLYQENKPNGIKTVTIIIIADKNIYHLINKTFILVNKI
jgi:hypothetical protein